MLALGRAPSWGGAGWGPATGKGVAAGGNAAVGVTYFDENKFLPNHVLKNGVHSTQWDHDRPGHCCPYCLTMRRAMIVGMAWCLLDCMFATTLA